MHKYSPTIPSLLTHTQWKKYSSRVRTEGVHWQFWGYGPPSLRRMQIADLKGHGFQERSLKAQDRLTRHRFRSLQPIQGLRCDKRYVQEVVLYHAQKEGPTQVMVLRTEVSGGDHE